MAQTRSIADATPTSIVIFKHTIDISAVKTATRRRAGERRHELLTPGHGCDGHGGLDQKDNGTEGRKPEIDDRRIGEENGPCRRFAERDRRKDEGKKGYELCIERWLPRFDRRLVRAVVFADHGDVYARIFAAIQDRGGIVAYGHTARGADRLKPMIVAPRLNRHMAVGPKAQDPGRPLARAQAKMPEQRDDKPQAKASLETG
ncbi:MAG: hypothetical protein ACREXK_14605 [Gammaproteobacteria bacterium]